MSSLSGKVAIVTGASRGIGAAIAVRLAKDGAAVVINYSQNAAAANQVVSQIQAAHGQAIAVQANVSDLSQLENLFHQTQAHYGRLDILVNNAGVSSFRKLDEIDAAYYQQFFDTNVRAALFAMQYAARYFDEAGGRIINISSGITQDPNPEASVYAGTKAALEIITKSIASELGPRQINVNALAPGVVSTEMLDSMISPEWQQNIIRETPLGRIGTPEDIADVVAFLSSEDSRWITGSIIGVNGGMR